MSAKILAMPGVNIEQTKCDATDPVLALVRDYFLEFHCNPEMADALLEFLDAEGLDITPAIDPDWSASSEAGERIPDGDYVLGWCKASNTCIVVCWDDGRKRFQNPDLLSGDPAQYDMEITHWRVLPNGPNGEFSQHP